MKINEQQENFIEVANKLGYNLVSIEFEDKTRIYQFDKFECASNQIKYHDLKGKDITDFITNFTLKHQITTNSIQELKNSFIDVLEKITETKKRFSPEFQFIIHLAY